jgi:hypothetical protein
MSWMPMAHPWLTVVGDVHSNIADYLRLVRDSAYSIQLGDLGFDYSLLEQLDPACHRFLPGNHDNYAALPPHALGDFGVWSVPDADLEEVSGDIFFVRGAFSIDRLSRTENVDWFAEEELSDEQFAQAVALYAKRKPDFVISHDCPTAILRYVSNFGSPARTNRHLQQMLDVHRPKRWFFAHHHFTWGRQIDGTLFFCIGELAALDMDKQLRIGPNLRGGRSSPIA